MTTNSTWAALRNPAFRKRGDFRNWCGRLQQRNDLDDECFLPGSLVALVDGVSAFLFWFTLPAGALYGWRRGVRCQAERETHELLAA
jgi:hypothetical protein